MKKRSMQHVKNWCLALGLFALFAVGCKENKRSEAEKIVRKWIGKEIVFPEGSRHLYMDSDTLWNPDVSRKPYTLLVYTDSIGCISCKLDLKLWKYYMEEMDSVAPNKVDFVFYFQPKNKKELGYILLREKFEKIVYVDENGRLKDINSFSDEMEYQCFLLDEDNKIVSIGNPTLNPKIWNIYKKIISK